MLIDNHNKMNWLNHAWENYNTDIVLNWSLFYAEQEVPNLLPIGETNLLLLFFVSSPDSSLKLIKKSTKFLNPGHTALMACDHRSANLCCCQAIAVDGIVSRYF